MNSMQRNMSLTGEPPKDINTTQKIAVLIGIVGLAIILLAGFNIDLPFKEAWFYSALAFITFGILLFAQGAYTNKQEGIKNNGIWFKSISSRGILAWIAGISLTGFYIVLYFYPNLLGLSSDGNNTGIISLFDPLSRILSGNAASQWFVYGTLYTIAIFAFGIKFIYKYRHNKYEQLRTGSVMFFQLGFAFLIPEFMARLNESSDYNLPYYDLKSIWPLNYYLFDEWSVNGLLTSGNVGLAMLIFGVLSIFVISPILTYKYGKRWYCSWVCGCGGLAETAGDSFRQLSSKKMSAWKIERWLIHTVLVFSIVMTTAMIYTYLGSDPNKFWLTKAVFLLSVVVILTLVFAVTMIFRKNELGKDARYGAIGYFVVIGLLLAMYFTGTTTDVFFINSGSLRSAYGLYIGSIFSGVVGTGFYPILGSRVWCRFGCPMAGILGFQQRMFSKFRITTNGGQCISCGNCSTYCEMGIDVRAYAQKGENIVRSSCVGCGICSAVCPRGVLKLENGPLENRIKGNEILLGNDIDLMKYVNRD